MSQIMQAFAGLLQQHLYYFIAHETTSVKKKQNIILLQHSFYFIAHKATP